MGDHVLHPPTPNPNPESPYDNLKGWFVGCGRRLLGSDFERLEKTFGNVGFVAFKESPQEVVDVHLQQAIRK